MAIICTLFELKLHNLPSQTHITTEATANGIVVYAEFFEDWNKKQLQPISSKAHQRNNNHKSQQVARYILHFTT